MNMNRYRYINAVFTKTEWSEDQRPVNFEDDSVKIKYEVRWADRYFQCNTHLHVRYF